MEYTAIDQVTAVEHPAADRAGAYGLEPVLIDGNDVELVYQTARRAIDQARRGGGPSLIEAKTYRHGGHSRADPGKYRPDDEVAAWLARDPLTLYRERLLAVDVEEGTLVELENAAQAEVDEATEIARNSPPPDEDIAKIDLWADGGVAWRN